MSSLFPWIEIIFTFFAMVMLIVRKKSAISITMIGLYLLTLILFRDYQLISLDVLFSHTFAIPHIVASWAAKTLILFAAVCQLTNSKTCPNLVKICITLQSLAIILGMFWAFDAPEWGSLWQWDGIETLSLCTLSSLLIWKKSVNQPKLAAAISILTVIAQNLALYGFGMNADLSRHSYTQLPQSHFFWIAGQCLFFVILCIAAYSIHKKAVHSFEISKSIRAHILTTSGFVCAGISILICAGISINKTLLWIVFAILWLVSTYSKSRLSGIYSICGLVFILLPALLPTNTSVARIKTEPDQQTQLVLAGIHAEPDNDLLHYSADIARNDHYFSLNFDADCEGIHPKGHADIRTGLKMERFWAVDYKASQGITLLIRDITYDKSYELLLVLVFCASLGSFIPRKQSQNDLKDS